MIETRSARSDDLDFLLKLRGLTMRPHFLASGISLSEEEDCARVLDNFEFARVILHDGAPIGLVKLVRKADPWLLQQLQLLPEFQSRGIGAGVIGTVLAQAHAEGVGVELHVLKQNHARRLYERMGFTVVGEHQHSVTMLCKA